MHMACGLEIGGGGLFGGGALLTDSDIKGARIGSAARCLLLSLPAADVPPLQYEQYDHWHRVSSPSSAERRVINRLLGQGLIWRVLRYAKMGSSDYEICLALTPLGADVLEAYGEKIKKGQRIRWDSWDRSCVAATPERWQQVLDGLIDRGFLQVVTEGEIRKWNWAAQRKMGVGVSGSMCKVEQYGNSSQYVIERIWREDHRWGDVILQPWTS